MRQVGASQTWLGTLGEAGDAALLEANGFALAIVVNSGKIAMPHSSRVPVIALNMAEDALSRPDWGLRALAKLGPDILGRKVFVADQSGGLGLALHLLICNRAANTIPPPGYGAILAQLKVLLGDTYIPADAEAQGRRLWP